MPGSVGRQAPERVGELRSGSEPPPSRTKQCRQCLADLPMAMFARVPGGKRAKTCTPCELALQQSEQDGTPRQCRACRLIRPLAQFPPDPVRPHGTLCATCLAVRRRRYPESSPSVIPDLPDSVFLVNGLCSDPRTVARVGFVWTSSIEADRRLARALCRSCPVSVLCMEWSLHLPAWDPAIYAGLSGPQRRRLRRTAAS